MRAQVGLVVIDMVLGSHLLSNCQIDDGGGDVDYDGINQPTSSSTFFWKWYQTNKELAFTFCAENRILHSNVFSPSAGPPSPSSTFGEQVSN